MNCEEFVESLLDRDSLSAFRAEETAHLAACASCRARVQCLAAAESSWRETALPRQCEESRSTFLKGLERQTPVRRPWFGAPRLGWAMAVSLLGVVVLGGWLTWGPSEAEAADLLDALVEWNLTLADPESADRDREAARADHFAVKVERMPWSEEDRILAQKLLTQGTQFAHHPDPLAAADHFEGLAEAARLRVAGALREGRHQEAHRWARRYGSLEDRGVKAPMERSKKKGLSDQQARRWEQLERRQKNRVATIQLMLEQFPDASRQELRRSLGLPTKKGLRGSRSG